MSIYSILALNFILGIVFNIIFLFIFKSKAILIAKKIVMTAGPEGAYYFEGETVVHEVALKVDNVIDTTGAGDNFASGFLYGLSKNFSLEK